MKPLAPLAEPDSAVVEPASSLRGAVRVPGDKSISHRAAILNGLSAGEARITRYATGADCQSTLGCLRGLGVGVESIGHADASDGGSLLIRGRGGELDEATTPLDAGNSGTTMRLLAGVLAGRPILSVLIGDASLSARPMGRVVEPLRRMGASILGRQGGRLAPLAIQGGGLRGIRYDSPVASAQIKSALLLAGLAADGPTTVASPLASRDHTERMLAAQGARVTVDGPTVSIEPTDALKAVDVDVPGDFSSAAYWLALGCAHPDAEITVRDVGTNPTRTGLLDVLREMGGQIEVANERVVAGEPRADLTARSSDLRGVAVGGALVPRAIDELPLVAILALFADGVTEIRDAAELRVKESDRVAVLARELGHLGASVEELPDGLQVRRGRLAPDAVVDPLGDHRLAMALTVAGLAGTGVRVRGATCVAVSYPEFWSHAETLGAPVRAEEHSAWA